ncbi:uncharacterized protein TNCV_4648481 [Trichonephila clavipes]|uniref:Uncharacterized protein n=1 Tax=Trichonephila clavipes TaxID=2585209 RepID=A0A8X6SUH5_TRICX|nr:uncharacterized protein TNCV_4648481 [Trichonephila clavipes]
MRPWMNAVYGEFSLCRVKMLWNGVKDSLEDDARPKQTHRVITPEMIAEVNVLVLDNRRITMDEIHLLLGTTHTIMHQHLNFRKIWARRTAQYSNVTVFESFATLS